MRILQLKVLNVQQKEEVFDLWNKEYPVKITHKSIIDFENYLKKLTEQSHYLLLNENELVVGWASIFTRENERWFAIIISGKIQGKGYGTKMLNALKKCEPVLNGWVIDHNLDKKLNGKPYLSPLEFYLKNEFKLISDHRLELDFMSAVKIYWTK